MITENDALRYIRTSKRLSAGDEVIVTRGEKIVGSAGNEPDAGQVVVLAMAQEDDGMVSKRVLIKYRQGRGRYRETC